MNEKWNRIPENEITCIFFEIDKGMITSIQFRCEIERPFTNLNDISMKLAGKTYTRHLDNVHTPGIFESCEYMIQKPLTNKTDNQTTIFHLNNLFSGHHNHVTNTDWLLFHFLYFYGSHFLLKIPSKGSVFHFFEGGVRIANRENFEKSCVFDLFCGKIRGWGLHVFWKNPYKWVPTIYMHC